MFRLTRKTANLAAIALTAVGCLQMVGYVGDLRPLRGIGAALAIAPFPKVFSDVEGLETFASSFTLRWRDAQGSHELPITPELYARLEGAYNRRNVYGAALSYGPRLPTPLWQAVFCYGFATHGPLRREFGLGPDAHAIAVEIRTNTKGRIGQWTLQPSCTE
jgi:hypothetical protein